MHVLFDRVKSEAANIFSAKKKIPVSIFEKSKIPSIQIVTKTILHNLYIRNFWFGSNWRSSFFFGNKTQIFFSPYLSPSRIFLSWNQIMCYESGHITSDRFPQLFPPTGLKTKWLTLHLCFNFSWLLFFNKITYFKYAVPQHSWVQMLTWWLCTFLEYWTHAWGTHDGVPTIQHYTI